MAEHGNGNSKVEEESKSESNGYSCKTKRADFKSVVQSLFWLEEDYSSKLTEFIQSKKTTDAPAPAPPSDPPYTGYFTNPDSIPFAKDRERTFKLQENRDKYMRLLRGTEDFCVGEWKESEMSIIEGGRLHSYSGSDSDEFSHAAAEYAVSFFSNREGREEELTKLKQIIRVNVRFHFGYYTIYYLTLEASDNKFYEAVVVYSYDKKERAFKYIRPAKYYPEIPAHLRHLLGPA